MVTLPLGSLTTPNLIGLTRAYSDTVAKGIVSGKNPASGASVSPAAGATTAKGAVVGILVSQGPDPSVSVPMVVG